MAFAGVKGIRFSGRRVAGMMKSTVSGAPGAADFLKLTLNSIRDLQNQEESGVLTQGIDEAIRLRSAGAQRQAEAGAGLGGAARINPFLAASQISSDLVQRERIRVENEQRREALIGQHLRNLGGIAAPAFSNPAAALISGAAGIRAASIEGYALLEKARLEKGNELLAFASGALNAAGTAVGGL